MRDRVGGSLGAMQAADLRPRIERDDWLAEFLREANLGQSAALAGQGNHRVGARDDHRIARLSDTGGNREFDMRICRASVVAREYSTRMPAFLARARPRRFHYARTPAVYQHRAATSDLA